MTLLGLSFAFSSVRPRVELSIIEVGSTLTAAFPLSAWSLSLKYTPRGVVGPIMTGTTMAWAGRRGAMLPIVALISVKGAVLAISRRTKFLSTG
jgi:hypothetical protein